MADFTAAVVTNAGIAADATALANHWVLNITKIQVGSGTPSALDAATLKALTALITPVALVSPAPNPPYANLIGVNNLVTYQASIRFEVNSAWVSTQFNLTEAGVWATLNAGAEFLYAYAYAASPDTITSSVSGSPVDNQYSLVIPYAETPTITVTLGVYPTVNLHAANHLDNGIDPIPVSTTSRTGSLPKLSGNVNDVLHGDGTWAAGFMPGMSIDYRGLTAPAGWLQEDGSAVSRSTYSALYAVIGNTYGAGNGTTTFNLPDSRGRVNIGSGTGTYTGTVTARTIGQAGGAETSTLAIANMPAHSHSVYDPTHTHYINDPTHGHAGSYLPNHGHGGSYLPDHAHSVYDPAHRHGFVYIYGNTGAPIGLGPMAWTGGYNNFAAYSTTDVAATGIAIYGAGNLGLVIAGAGNLTLGITGARTGVYNSYAGTGISLYNNGQGAAFDQMDPFIVSLKIIKT